MSPAPSAPSARPRPAPHALSSDHAQPPTALRHRRHSGRRPEVQLRHDVQAAACRHGLRARPARRRLAAKGFTARSDSLECDQGFAAIAERSPSRSSAALAEPPRAGTCATTSSSIMRRCYLTHAPIECVQDIRLKSNFPPERVKKIVLRIDAGADKVCNIPHPDDRAGGQVLAAPDGGDGADRRRYRQCRLLHRRRSRRSRASRRCATRSSVDVHAELAHHAQPRWRSSSTTARTLEATHDSRRPWADVAKQRHALEKFDSLVAPVLGAAGHGGCMTPIERIDSALAM